MKTPAPLRFEAMTLTPDQLELPWFRQPSFVMLALLMLSLVIYPFAEYAREYRVMAQLVDIVIVLQVVHLVRAVGYWIGAGWVLAVPLVTLQIAALFLDMLWIEPLLLTVQVCFHAYAVFALLAYILSDTVVTLDELFAIGAVYVLLALLWASAYALLVHFSPQAFFINPVNNLDGKTGFGELVYFSMTTLTSVGFGEITPVTPTARALVMLQQVTGVLYVAILIARLTGLYGRRRQE